MMGLIYNMRRECAKRLTKKGIDCHDTARRLRENAYGESRLNEYAVFYNALGDLWIAFAEAVSPMKYT